MEQQKDTSPWPGIGLVIVDEVSSYGWIDPKFDARDETIEQVVEVIRTHGSF